VNKGIRQTIWSDVETWNNWTNVVRWCDGQHFPPQEWGKISTKVAEEMPEWGSLHGNQQGNRTEFFRAYDTKYDYAFKAVHTYLSIEMAKLQREMFKKLETEGIGFLRDALAQNRQMLEKEENAEDSV